MSCGGQRSWAGGRFDRNALVGDADRGDYAAVAVRLQMTEAAARKAAHDLRADFRQLLVREVRRTVDSSAGIEPEIRTLLQLFAG